MEKIKFPKNYIGLDIGTDFLGYAVTDEEYNVVKTHGKRTLGIVNFNEAQTAAERRGYRTSARRLVRRHQRINLLQELFAEEIEKTDPNFLRRLDENDLQKEDRTVGGDWSLFNDRGFTDKQYYKKYPTIYHLRKALMEEGTDDIRLLYLAVHHIIKYRGHFLMEGDVADAESLDPLAPVTELNEAIEIRNANLDGSYDLDVLSIDRLGELKPLLTGNARDAKGYVIRGAKRQKACLYEIFGIVGKQGKALTDSLISGKVNSASLFGTESYDNETKIDIVFDTYEDKVGEYSASLDPDDFNVVEALKKLYDWFLLIKLLSGYKTLSDAMVAMYEKHKKDLAELKALIRKYGTPKMYADMFEKIDDKTKNNYVAYIGGGRIGKNKITAAKCTATKDFYAYVKKELGKITAPDAQARIGAIAEDIENGEYMPRIVSKNNSTLPYQLNKAELEKILDVAKKSGKFEFLKGVSDGMTVSEKIISLLTFRIPYYVGPISEKSKTRGGSEVADRHWAVRKDVGRITPWNFDDKIDKKASSRKFIDRMTVGCTYLKLPKALPKHSFTFEKFMAINELNALKVNGERLPVEIKKHVFENVYLKQKATVKNIDKFLRTNYGYDEVRVTGYDKELKGDMPTYRAFEFLGNKRETCAKELDDVVGILTIHDDKALRKEAIAEKYSNIFAPEEIDRLASKKTTGWGRLSGEFLRGSLYADNGFTIDADGSEKDILDVMYDSDQTLMEILFDERYSVNERLRDYYERTDQIDGKDVTYRDVENMYCSPSVKRSLWQTFRVIKEIVSETGAFPKKIFIEVTRKEDVKKKGTSAPSRLEMLNSQYAEAEKAKRNIDKVYRDRVEAALAESKSKLASFDDNSRVRAEKYYLYFLQLGIDAYTGEPINLDDLKDYDVDHIVPQSKIKDDSIKNKVLTHKSLNGAKSDSYPVPVEYRKAGAKWWKAWLKMGLMSKEKYDRLTRTTPVTEEEQARFINRQLVETAQIATCLRELLDKWIAYKKDEGALCADADIEINFVKGNNVSEFRKEFALTKSRDVNDFHHAYDAYMNIVVGNVLFEYFNHNRDWREAREQKDAVNPMKLFGRAVRSDRENRVIWYPENTKSDTEPTINKVRKMCSLVPIFAKQTVRGKGQLYKETILKAKAGTSVYPIKENGPKSDMSKYGGYKSSGTAFFVVVDYNGKKGAVERSIEAVSVYHDVKIRSGKMTIEEYLSNVRGLKNPRLAEIAGLKDSKILPYSLVMVDHKYCVRISGYSGNSLTLNNANQLFVSDAVNAYIKELRTITEKVANRTGGMKAEDKERAQEEYCNYLIEENVRRKNAADGSAKEKAKIVIVSREKNIELYDFFIEKLSEKPYAFVPGYDGLLDVLKRARGSFEQIPLYAEIKTLLNILCAFQCNAKNVDVSSLEYIDKKGKKVCGGTRLASPTLNKCITDKSVVLITQSRAGLREKRIELGLNYGIQNGSNKK